MCDPGMGQQVTQFQIGDDNDDNEDYDDNDEL
jgi:hypothetical protein